MREPWSNDTRYQWTYPVSTSLFLNTVLLAKKPGTLGGMTDSRTEAWKIQDEFGAPWMVESLKALKSLFLKDRACQKDTGVNLQVFYS